MVLQVAQLGSMFKKMYDFKGDELVCGWVSEKYDELDVSCF